MQRDSSFLPMLTHAGNPERQLSSHGQGPHPGAELEPTDHSSASPAGADPK